MSKVPLVLLIVTATITLVANLVSSQPPTQPTFQYILCNFKSGSYSSYSPYEANLRAALSTLQQQASTSGLFYSTSSGADPETVYGQYYCRGDVSTDICGACIGEATQKALNTCGQAKGAIVWYEECTLRYSNQSMYGILDVDDQHPYSIAYSSATVSSDPNMFYVVLNDTMTTLIEEAASSNRFATGEGKVYGSDLTVYCLVQCSPELQRAQCDTCLQSVYSDMLTCCGQWPASLYAFYPSCQVMYNADAPFYYGTPGAPWVPPAPFIASPPTSSPPPPTSDSAPSTPPPPSPSLAVPPSSTVPQPPPLSTPPPPPPSPSLASPPSSTVSQPPSPATLAAPPPSMDSQQPSSSSTTSPPLTGFQPPPSLNGGATIITRESVKVWIVTTMLLPLMLVLNL